VAGCPGRTVGQAREGQDRGCGQAAFELKHSESPRDFCGFAGLPQESVLLRQRYLPRIAAAPHPPSEGMGKAKIIHRHV
jgi:hypothetical protein